MDTTIFVHPRPEDKPHTRMLEDCIALHLGTGSSYLTILLSSAMGPAVATAYLRVLAQVATDAANEIAAASWGSSNA